MSEKKEPETKKTKDPKDVNGICQSCGSELTISYGNDLQGKLGLMVQCPKCGTLFVLQEW